MKSLSEALADFRTAKKAHDKLVQNLPRIIGFESVKVVKENFKLQGYDSGAGVNGWPKRKPKTDKSYDKRGKLKGSVYNSSNPLLMQTRNLYNSVNYFTRAKQVLIGVDLNLIPYAQKMNEQRQYMPQPSESANAKIIARVLNKINFEQEKILKPIQK